jgi:hypothetical protein
MTPSTFTSNPAPKPDRFRDGDIWRSPNGDLFAVCSLQGMAEDLCMLRPLCKLRPLCLLRPCGHSCQSRLVRRTSTMDWTRTSWGGKP